MTSFKICKMRNGLNDREFAILIQYFITGANKLHSLEHAVTLVFGAER